MRTTCKCRWNTSTQKKTTHNLDCRLWLQNHADVMVRSFRNTTGRNIIYITASLHIFGLKTNTVSMHSSSCRYSPVHVTFLFQKCLCACICMKLMRYKATPSRITFLRLSIESKSAYFIPLVLFEIYLLAQKGPPR